MKRTKTWKIGEECEGGIVQVKVSGNDYFPGSITVKILVKEWETGKTLSSQVFGRIHVYKLESFLNQITTHYHASRIMEWIKENAFTYPVLVTMEGARS